MKAARSPPRRQPPPRVECRREQQIRWRLPQPPNLSDGTVYMDELLNLLITKYGNASTPNGIKGYDLDNEPDLWASTHPLLHPALPTCAEIVSKSDRALPRRLKRMDPSAEVLGPASYGSNGYFTFQNAPDWASIQAATPAYRWFPRLLPRSDEQGFDNGGSAPARCPRPPPL